MRRITIILLLLVNCPYMSRAAAYWMEIQGSGKVNEAVTIRLIYGNIDESGIRHRQTDRELALTGEFRLSVTDQLGRKTPIVITQKEDCWEGTFTPHEKGTYQITGINDTHPVVDRSKSGGQNILPIDYLCSAYTVGEGAPVSKPLQLLDIIVSPKGKMMSVKAFLQGKSAASGTRLRVFNPENWEKELVLNEQGEAFFMPTMKGLYIIREDWVDAKPGTYKGLAYSSIRHRCNYCLLVP